MADIAALVAPPRRARLTFPTALRHALNLSPMALVHAARWRRSSPPPPRPNGCSCRCRRVPANGK